MRTYARTLPHFLALSLAVLLASACGGDDREIRDGGTPPDGTPCSTHLNCGADEICVEGYCEPAYDREYRIGIGSVILSRDHSPDMTPWDEDGTAPDPYVCLIFGNRDEEVEYCTEVAEDAYEPVFDTFTAEPTISERQRLQIHLCDEDEGEPECWVVTDQTEVLLQTLRTTSITYFPDDVDHMGDWAVTISYQPI